ncbi:MULTISPECIES: 2-oxoglutarate dehydrogenase complex dihydrolipoyllysine-residue succinyltransferase [Sphingobium]|jgi:2-oxoglutarate dehydrogenase E2 component (dihydrolipoamide succinyltransferase)|uniref:Dihydrolipoyllysine-residue succinyltransferase component of 2-oxoglutarate dehydrogenase complex n=1 Tax=Sphingobium limneticum TaxID=1007511 RepID=A0A5J5I8R9_9SPHN|nr:MULTISPECIES: 2-oxoglutarate dehydrogenase complex dihydrolipoyllysine-residue succinyltransferase [Sphingobium]MBU0931258.1 2-oxoglutarate dehydrogenase complex dihydrolipoyllysine-residue succinyltransferase [Alphaproteobacteria bacterium]KAA9013596.1 2-oxoglutarate dehydrogenase complex dihydrolipoyllysine-residue succinyltransferase [Sphingobium limneticum]KAA9020845.1 2-oxoglutarate dehydrogenase complex dihydrolipoyllysine-residue succinyltransferase [Sphingobium limneticum]KAA9033172.
MATEVKVPTLGESVTEATVGQWLKKPGEAVKVDEPIVSLETDKVAVDVPSTVAGVMGDIIAKEGDTVEVGALLAYVNEGGSAAAAPAPAAAAPAAKAEAAAPAPAASAPAASDDEDGGNLTLSPAVRRLVLEHGLDPSKIKGTGKDGRLTKDDVTAAAAAGTAKAAAGAVAAAPAADAPAAGPSRKQERVKMTRLRQTVAKRLKEAQNTAALLTTYNDVDMTNIIEARAKYKDLFEKKHGVRLGFMGFFTKAVCMALRDIPGVNAQIEGDEIVYNDFCDISVAVSAPTGLVVPVIRNAEALSVADIEKTIGGFGKKAKEGKLTMEDMKGGTFTISNGGVFGSLLSSPIINPPQSAVLGLHRIEERPVVRNGQIVARPMMYLALSYDHRMVDGREAVTFLVAVKNAIEDPTRLLIDL